MTDVTVSRFSWDGFTPHAGSLDGQEELTDFSGCWVFIRGAETEWSLPEARLHPACPVWIGSLSGDAEVVNFLSWTTTAGEVLRHASRLVLERGYASLDHEDAGFFIPASSLRKLRNSRPLAWACEILPLTVFDPVEVAGALDFLPRVLKAREDGVFLFLTPAAELVSEAEVSRAGGFAALERAWAEARLEARKREVLCSSLRFYSSSSSEGIKLR